MRLIYILASYLLFWILFPVLLVHPKTRHGLWQRLGFYPKNLLPDGGHPRLWLHGASAGDLLSLSPMIRQLRQRFPQCKIILSTMTNTGYLMASERLARDIDAAIYVPYDLLGAARRAVRAIRPDLLVLEYAEIWPNLISAAKRAGAKVALTNGRFAPDQMTRYRAFFSLIKNPLRQIDLLLMREDDEAERALGLGAPLERVWVTGNTKFDALTPSEMSPEDVELREGLGLPAGAPVLIAGSTHEGEEESLLSAFGRLRQHFPELRFVIAPRYVDRAHRVGTLATEAGFAVGFRSQRNTSGASVIILDTIGELARAYRLATLVFVGGSFTRRGGQNILEPAAQGKPVLFGPNMENFHDSVQVLVGRGGIQVNDPEHFYYLALELLSRPDHLASLGELAKTTVRQISGASQRNVDHLQRLVEGR